MQAAGIKVVSTVLQDSSCSCSNCQAPQGLWVGPWVVGLTCSRAQELPGWTIQGTSCIRAWAPGGWWGYLVGEQVRSGVLTLSTGLSSINLAHVWATATLQRLSQH